MLKLVSKYSVAVLAMIVLAGCQSSAPQSAQTTAPPTERAIVVSGGNTGTVTVFVPTADPNHPMVYCTGTSAECPECRAAAVKYFTTGVLDPKCSLTGATRTLAAPVTVQATHAYN